MQGREGMGIGGITNSNSVYWVIPPPYPPIYSCLPPHPSSISLTHQREDTEGNERKWERQNVVFLTSFFFFCGGEKQGL